MQGYDITTTTLLVDLATRAFGGSTPQLVVRCARGTHHRALRALLFTLGAQVELASVRHAWCVRVEQDTEFSGRIVLELVRGSQQEVDCGAEVLRNVIMSAKAGAQ